MIICAALSLQSQILPWLTGVEACYATIQELEQALQDRPQPLPAPTPILLEAAGLLTLAEPERQLARLHVLSGHKPVIIGEAAQLDQLSETAVSLVFTLLNLPLGARSLHMLQSQLRAEAERQQQLAGHELRLVQLMDENRRLRLRIQQESSLDPLTGLYHRRAFEDKLEEEWRRAHRHGHPISGIAIQFPGLQPGTPAADTFLAEMARRLRAVRASDVVGRLDDNSFVLVLPLTFQEGAQALSAHFRALTAKLIESHALAITAEVAYCAEIPRCHNDGNRFLTRLLSACATGFGSPGKEALLV